MPLFWPFFGKNLKIKSIIHKFYPPYVGAHHPDRESVGNNNLHLFPKFGETIRFNESEQLNIPQKIGLF